MGVETTVVWDRVWLNDELIEDTRDWFAQDKEGSVWYFGEDSVEMIDGKIVNHAGSWEVGVDGALPGIIMKANPVVGETFQQEFYEGEAEDRADVISAGESVTVPYGNFLDCIKTLDYTPLQPAVKEHKYYCPDIGGVVLEVDLDGGEQVKLISVEFDADPTPKTVEKPEQLVGGITEEQAKEIAVKEIPGSVTNIEIERKFGKVAYVVEVISVEGVETDVIIDYETGEVLATES